MLRPLTSTALFAFVTLVAFSLGGSACGGVALSDPASANIDGATLGADSGNDLRDGGYTTPNDAGACWLDRPTALRLIPPELPWPSTSPGIRVSFQLRDHKLVPVALRAEGVAPAWTSKDTQIFEEGKTSGFWVELRSKNGTLLYQRSYFDPLGTHLEAPGAPRPAPPPPELDSGFRDPAPTDAGFQNIPVCPRDGAELFVEIPNDPAATELRLYSDPLSGPPSTASLVGWFKVN